MNELETLEELLNELLLTIQEVLASGETLSDEFQLVLAEELQFLTSRIDELRAESSTPQVPDLDEAMPSSNVSAFRYDPKQKKLFVQFLGEYPNRQGSVYSYEGVPPQVFEMFRKGSIPATTKGKNRWGSWWVGKKPSVGSSMYHLIRGLGYPYQRVS